MVYIGEIHTFHEFWSLQKWKYSQYNVTESIFRKHAPPAQSLTNIMDVDSRIVFIYYINRYLKDIVSKQLILSAKNDFFQCSLLYFGTISGYFYGQYMGTKRLYENKCNFGKYYPLNKFNGYLMLVYIIIKNHLGSCVGEIYMYMFLLADVFCGKSDVFGKN
eukprot:20390_1